MYMWGVGLQWRPLDNVVTSQSAGKDVYGLFLLFKFWDYLLNPGTGQIEIIYFLKWNVIYIALGNTEAPYWQDGKDVYGLKIFFFTI